LYFHLITLVFSKQEGWRRLCSIANAEGFHQRDEFVLRKTGALLMVLALATGTVATFHAQDSDNEVTRKVRSRVEPMYPALARKMNLTGTVKVEVVVAPDGTVKEAKVVGGHPLLASAALDAVRKWRFEPAPVESTGTVNFKFEPHQ
jgi:TonB family protein